MVLSETLPRETFPGVENSDVCCESENGDDVGWDSGNSEFHKSGESLSSCAVFFIKLSVLRLTMDT